MKNLKWPYLAFRAFAVTNFVIATLGLFFSGISLVGVSGGAVGNNSDQPYFIPSFWTMLTINYCFLGLLVFGSIRLLQRRMVGVAVCNAVFFGEILYFISIGIIWGSSLSRSVSMSIATATGVGNAGLSPQLVCGYPLIALAALNLARWRLHRQKPQDTIDAVTSP